VLAGVFLWLWGNSGDDVGWALRLAALFPLCYVLLQGSLYWHLKLRSVSERAPLPAWFAPLFRFFERSNVFALGVPLAALAVSRPTSAEPARQTPRGRRVCLRSRRWSTSTTTPGNSCTTPRTTSPTSGSTEG
jgi:hypothetical protein